MPALVIRDGRLLLCGGRLALDTAECMARHCGEPCPRLFPSGVCGGTNPEDCSPVAADRWWCEGVVCSTSGETLGQMADRGLPSIVLVDNGLCHAVDLSRCGFIPRGTPQEPESPFPPDDAPSGPGAPCGPIPLDPPPVVVVAGSYECVGNCTVSPCGASGYIYGDACDPNYSGPIPSVCAGSLVRECFVIGLVREDTGEPFCFEFRLGAGFPTPTAWDVGNLLTPEVQATAPPSCCECGVATADCSTGETTVPCSLDPGPECCCGSVEFRTTARTHVTAYRFAFWNDFGGGLGELHIEDFLEETSPGNLIDVPVLFILRSRIWINSNGTEGNGTLVLNTTINVESFVGCDGVGGGPLGAQFATRCPGDTCTGASECLVGASLSAYANNREGGFCDTPIVGWFEQSWQTSIDAGTPGDICDPLTCRDAPQPLTSPPRRRRKGCASCNGGKEVLTPDEVSELESELG